MITVHIPTRNYGSWRDRTTNQRTKRRGLESAQSDTAANRDLEFVDSSRRIRN